MSDSALKPDVADGGEYTRKEIPDGHTYTGLHIALIIIGGTIGMAVFIMASEIGSRLGMRDAAIAFVCGAAILGSLIAVTSYVGAESRLSTYMLIEFAYGVLGARWINTLIAVTLVGWYGVISNVFGLAAAYAISDLFAIDLPVWVYVVGGSALMVGVTLSGFKGIDTLALYMVPLMAIFIGYAAYEAWWKVPSWALPSLNAEPMQISTAVSAVVGSYIVGAIIQPDYSRFSKNVKHAAWAAFLALGISFPIILFLAAVPSAATGNSDIISVMVAIGIGVPAFFLILLGSWSSNVLCLYSAGLSLSTIFTGVPLLRIIILTGGVGTVMALMGAQDYITAYLIFLGIAIPPIGAIYTLDFLLLRKRNCHLAGLSSESPYNYHAFVAWLLGGGAGWLSVNDVVTITQIASLDSIFVALLIYVLRALPYNLPNLLRGSE